METQYRSGRARSARLMAACLVLLAPLACGAQNKEKFVKVFFPDGRSVRAELAVTEAERARGLMFRTSVPPGEGMLFVFETDGVYSFWMKSTLIALDMIWLDSGKRVVHIERNVPPCRRDPCPAYGPDRLSRYVLELGAGGADAYGLKTGDVLRFALPDWVAKR
jgi:hypothetical protein